MAWIDERFPIDVNAEEAHHRILRAEKFQLLVFLRLAGVVGVGVADCDRYFPHHELQARCKASVCVGRIHHARCDWGWLIRYMHSTGASMFFVVVYLHMFRGFMYGSYRKPRELLWIFGMVIYVTLMAEAFFGYLLPWGQMSFWGAQVIVNLFSAVPWIGPDLSEWIRGDYVISDATLNRFFAFHVIALPLVLVGLVFLHIVALHQVGSNNPDGIEIKKKKDPKTGLPLDGIPFYPYYMVKDIVGNSGFLIDICRDFVFLRRTMGGYFLEYNNFVPADPMETPEHIAPVWYFTPFYAMLRAVPPMFGSQFPGVIVMGCGHVIFFLLPWLDKGVVKSIRYRGCFTKVGSPHSSCLSSFLAFAASCRPACGANWQRHCR